MATNVEVSEPFVDREGKHTRGHFGNDALNLSVYNGDGVGGVARSHGRVTQSSSGCY
jgi:hypothetical protein